MTTLAWLTDIHLDSAYPQMVQAVIDEVREKTPDTVLITGDIANGDCVAELVWDFQRRLNLPVYFVLGNHDLWGRRIEDVYAEVTKVCHKDLRWLHLGGVVELSPTVALVGDDGWYDGRAGDYYTSGFQIQDMNTIRDFRGIGKDSSLSLMQRLADRSTRRIKALATEAAEKYKEVVIATHMPPFVRACKHRGGSTETQALPYYCNYRMGDELVGVAYEFLETKFTVLAGHTHGAAEYSPVENLTCYVGGATYMQPQLQRVLELG